MPVSREKTKHAKLSNLKCVFFGAVTIIKQFRRRCSAFRLGWWPSLSNFNAVFRRSVWDGDLLENCAKNASDLREKREKKSKKKHSKKCIFRSKRSCIFFGLFPHKIYISRVIKPKKKTAPNPCKHYWYWRGRPVGRSAGRADPLLAQIPKKIG